MRLPIVAIVAGATILRSSIRGVMTARGRKIERERASERGGGKGREGKTKNLRRGRIPRRRRDPGWVKDRDA